MSSCGDASNSVTQSDSSLEALCLYFTGNQNASFEMMGRIFEGGIVSEDRFRVVTKHLVRPNITALRVVR